MPLQLFTGHFRGFSQNSTCWDGKAFHWSLMTSHCKAGRKCVEFTLCLSGSLPGKQKVFGLSAGLLHCLCRLGQPHGKVCFVILCLYSLYQMFVYAYDLLSPLLICVLSLRSHSRWAVAGRWRQLWILLRWSSAHNWWSLWWGSRVVSSTYSLFGFFFDKYDEVCRVGTMFVKLLEIPFLFISFA